MSINFNFQNGNKLQRVLKKKKKGKKTGMTSNQLLFVYINKQLKYYYRDAINS